MNAKEDFGILTCPRCGHQQRLLIPTNSCIPFYLCNGCNNIIDTKSCCVFCDYADRPCPVGKADKQ